MIRYLIEKEFKQLFRNPFLPKLIIGFPLMVMLILPWAATLEMKNIRLSVVDHARGPYSERLIEKCVSSGYFLLSGRADSYPEALRLVEKDQADLILEIPADFDRDLEKQGAADVLIAPNTVNGTKGSLGSSYLSSITADFAKEISREQTPGLSGGGIRIIPQNRFNPYLNYKVFMVPALTVVILGMICGFLPALNIVSEKEKGTIEQINVTPVGKFTFILSKLIPYWLIGFLELTLCFLLIRWVYALSPAGNIFAIYFFALLFVTALSGMGLLISNHSDTMQQAMFVIFFFFVIFMLMGGIFTPIASMPQWAQKIAAFNPLKYFIEVIRLIYLKGSTIGDLMPQAAALSGFAVFFNVLAVLSYRKRS